jgi:hypothetical protein
MRTPWLFALVLVLVTAGPNARAPQQGDSSAVAIEMRGVHLRAGDNIALDIDFLRGRLLSRSRGDPPVFDDGRSYVISVDLAEVSIDERSVNALVQRALGGGRSSLSDVRVTFEGPLLKQTGRLRRGVPVPFSVKSRVEPTADGRIRLKPVSVKAVGLPVAGLMKLFDIELEELLKVAPDVGIQGEENDLLLAPGEILPPPEMQGTLTKVGIRGNRMLQVFGSASALAAARREPHPRGHYVQFRGNRIQFGRLTMSNTDMRLIDADPKDPFDFYPGQYVAQLVAGYSKNTPGGALRVYMPDYNDLPEHRVHRRPRGRGN